MLLAFHLLGLTREACRGRTTSRWRSEITKLDKNDFELKETERLKFFLCQNAMPPKKKSNSPL